MWRRWVGNKTKSHTHTILSSYGMHLSVYSCIYYQVTPSWEHYNDNCRVIIERDGNSWNVPKTDMTIGHKLISFSSTLLSQNNSLCSLLAHERQICLILLILIQGIHFSFLTACMVSWKAAASLKIFHLVSASWFSVSKIHQCNLLGDISGLPSMSVKYTSVICWVIFLVSHQCP